jgi:hypothetical protein
MSENKRYVFHCVAPNVAGGPLSTNDLDEALLETASWIGSHWDIYDTQEKKYIKPICCEEEENEVRTRYEARKAAK